MKFFSLASSQIALVFSALLYITGPCLAAPESDNPTMVFAEFLNELSDRRRLQTFFPNEQSPFRGLQVNNVNVGDGNLTFLRRDLVTLARLPIVLGRVYDSSARDGTDFGRGWKLAPYEKISINSDLSFTYVDSSGSTYELELTDDVLALKTPFYSDFLNISFVGNEIEIYFRNLWVKKFAKLGDSYQLVEVVDNNLNTIELAYDSNNRLTELTSGKSKMTVERDINTGRIKSVADSSERSVSYRYSENGMLIEVIDVAGNPWKYEYDDAGQLIRVIDPLGNSSIEVEYDQERVVSMMSGGVATKFQYIGQRTEMYDGGNTLSVFEQNSKGLTYLIKNGLDLTTEVGFDTRNRVSKLIEDGVLKAEFEYAEDDRLEQLIRYESSGAIAVGYEYNWHKKVVTARTAHATQTQTYDDNGNLLSQVTKDRWAARVHEFSYQYNRFGDLTFFSSDNAEYEFKHSEIGLIDQVKRDGELFATLEYGSTGRLARTKFFHGGSVSYQYNSLGFRSRQETDEGDVEDYEYDASGNLVAISSTVSGRTVRKSFKLDKSNRLVGVDAVGAPSMRVEYDAAGNPIRVKRASSDLTFTYDPLQRVTGVRNAGKFLGHYDYDDYEPDLRKQEDIRTRGVQRLEVRSSAIYGSIMDVSYTRGIGSTYGAVIDNSGSGFALASEWGFADNQSAIVNALERTKVSRTNDTDDEANFKRPSNAFFIPPEYYTINCNPEPLPCAGTVGLVLASMDDDVGSLTSTTSVFVYRGANVFFTGSVLTGNCSTNPLLIWDTGQGDPVFSQGLTLSGTENYQASGVYSASFKAECPCEGGNIRNVNFSVNVIPFCNITQMTAAAKGFANSQPQNVPHEYGAVISCNDQGAFIQNITSTEGTGDVCQGSISGFNWVEDDIIHTHPFFTQANLASSGAVNCRGQMFSSSTNPTVLADKNNDNNCFSRSDIQASNSANRDSFLRQADSAALRYYEHDTLPNPFEPDCRPTIISVLP
ncbi:MAG: DUF6531 domain-containing protein [Pseudomonadota bacterium]